MAGWCPLLPPPPATHQQAVSLRNDLLHVGRQSIHLTLELSLRGTRWVGVHTSHGCSVDSCGRLGLWSRMRRVYGCAYCRCRCTALHLALQHYASACGNAVHGCVHGHRSAWLRLCSLSPPDLERLHGGGDAVHADLRRLEGP